MKTSFRYGSKEREMGDELELLKGLGRELSEPDEASVNRARELLRRRIELARPSRKRVRLTPHVRWAAAAAAVLLASGLGFGLGTWNTPDVRAETSLVGLGFLPAKGWTVVQSRAVGQGDAARAVAANVPLRANSDFRATVRATLASLPANGILIFATFTTRGDAAADIGFARRGLPLSLRRARPASQSVDQRLYRLRAGVRGYNVEVQIYFGSASPSAETIEVAQRQLNRLVVASERVTILARPTIVPPRQGVSLFGSIDSDKADEIVTIEARDCGQRSFRGVMAVRTREGGGWQTEVPYFVGITTTLRAVWNDNASAPVTVRQRASVSLQSHGSGVFEVGVGAKAPFWRKRVQIQRFERRLGNWATVKSVTLTETASSPGSPFVWSSAKFRAFFPRGSLIRASFSASQARPCYLAASSPQVRI
ncbi:MAG: hypothetical protein H0V45_08265 [Actinobacteria bacterium]|nr:hypothetical protein [Actinomycetota bacterium]